MPPGKRLGSSWRVRRKLLPHTVFPDEPARPTRARVIVENISRLLRLAGADENRHVQHQQHQSAPAQLTAWLSEAKPDVLCLQELKATDQGFPADALDNAGYSAVWNGQKTWNGV